MVTDAERAEAAHNLIRAVHYRRETRTSLLAAERNLDEALRQFERAFQATPLTGMELYAEHVGDASLAPTYHDNQSPPRQFPTATYPDVTLRRNQ
jgi:hypothetical protein